MAKLWLPNSVPKRVPIGACKVIVNAETRQTCGEVFYEGEQLAFDQHVIKCAKEHHEQIHDASLRLKLPGIFGDERASRDIEEWTRRNRREIIEGRKRLGKERFRPPSS